ncbi:MAG TPA: hypothetical protein PLR88_12505 [Bacteroidales bacterium]|nr:hypothetical protein [Bacteroidales bacterium]
MKRSGAVLYLLLFFSSLSFSQFDNTDFLRSAPVDATKIVQAYIAPWANAFGAGLNGGWYNTAKPHKFGGFDITAGVSVGMVPSSGETFDLSTLGLSSNITYDSKITPTVAGIDEEGPNVQYTVGGVKLAEFNTPPGSDWKYMPVPSLQVGIGLPFGTEIKGRFIPKIDIGDGDLSLWGVGLLHSITQYFPGNEMLPFDVSLFGGYTKLNANVPINLAPDPSVVWNYSTYNVATSFEDQNLGIDITSLNVSAVASLNLPVVTFYGGMGYSKTKTEINLEGNFPTPTLNTTIPSSPYAEYADKGVIAGEKFPSMEIKNFSGLRANIGIRFKLSVVTIHFDYTRAQYNILSSGLGLSFR